MSKIIAILALALGACADPVDPTPDAGIDEPSPCCDLLPDEDGARACFLAQPGTPPPGTCGAFVCRVDGEIQRINFCIPD